MSLTDLAVKKAPTTGKTYLLADTDGLYLCVSASGSRAWHFRYCWGGRRPRISFGSYPELSLRDARLELGLRKPPANGTGPSGRRVWCGEASLRLPVRQTENVRLKKMLAESMLEIEATREALQKKW
ncbi:Arm DNA-binding domain-containing protein [Pseudomonas sp. LRF_L74]|uniref:Arm DNA-binding domain-containing protein n=1 Tax=Pseudomonas sp. LRF_L74 TaxID=3369422 RepID=UPI003F60402E